MKFGELKVLFLIELEKAKNDIDPKTQRFVITAYKKVQRIISTVYNDEDEVSDKKISELPITQHMKDKLINLSKKKITASIKKIYDQENLKIQLANVLGIGNKKISELIKAGLKNKDQLSQKKYFSMLNKDTQLMIEHNPLRKIPHEYIKKFETRITAFPHALVQLVGSYRRGAPFSKDIDVLVRADELDILDDFIKYMRKEFNDKVYLYSQGPDKASLIIQPFLKFPTKVKLDAFRCSTDTYYTHLLYSTGSKDFNIRMRGRARKKGYLLNQLGLFNEKGKKINKPDDDERKLFNLVDMTYLDPKDRK